VKVIGHEAVRSNANVLSFAMLPKLHQDGANDFFAGEDVTAISRADCEGISILADVVERSQPDGATKAHVGREACRVPIGPAEECQAG
jgi:hypothetical protein